MEYVFSNIKKRFQNCTEFFSKSTLVFLCSLFFFYYLMLPGTWHWDDFSYLIEIQQKKPVGILLGRTGFVFPLEILWNTLEKFSINFYFIELFIRHLNVWALSLTYLLIYRIFIYFKVKSSTAFFMVILLLAEISFSVISSRPNDTPMMYFCVISSYYLFIMAHDKRSRRLLFTSAFFAGYAFLIREPGAFFLVALIPILFYFKARNQLLLRNNYFGFGLVVLIVSISGPLIAYSLFGKSYLDNFLLTYNKANVGESIGALFRIKIALETHLNFYTAGVCFIGFFHIIKKFGNLWLANLIFAALTPVFISTSMIEREAIAESRFFLGFFIIIAITQAHALELISRFFSESKLKHLFSVSLIFAICYSNFNRYANEYNSQRKDVDRLFHYYSRIKPNLSNNTVVLLGSETQMVRYRSMADGLNLVAISPGWYWPKGKLIETLEYFIRDKKTVIYDPSGRAYNNKLREYDIQKMTEHFQLIRIKNNFIEIKEKLKTSDTSQTD